MNVTSIVAKSQNCTKLLNIKKIEDTIANTQPKKYIVYIRAIHDMCDI